MLVGISRKGKLDSQRLVERIPVFSSRSEHTNVRIFKYWEKVVFKYCGSAVSFC